MRWLRRRRFLRVEITCPHGRFFPAHYANDGEAHRLSCDGCGFKVTVRNVTAAERAA